MIQVDGMLTGRVTALRAAFDRGDFLAVDQGLDTLSKGSKGLPQATELEALANDLAEHPEAATVMKGQKALAKLMGGELRKKKQLQKAAESAKKLEKKYAGTIVADKAKAFQLDIKKRLNRKR